MNNQTVETVIQFSRYKTRSRKSPTGDVLVVHTCGELEERLEFQPFTTQTGQYVNVTCRNEDTSVTTIAVPLQALLDAVEDIQCRIKP